MKRGILAAYPDRLPLPAGARVVTLGEGDTPLLRSDWLSASTGAEVHLKVEGTNPTGSFKDRGMTVAVTRALAAGAQAVVCASTGNTSASAAAYAARAGLTCAVLVPEGRVALGKLAQTLVHGARLLTVAGGFDDCLVLARRLADDHPVTLVNSVNPDRLDGQRTAAFEVCDALGRAPDVHCLPVGNAGNITAYWRGYREYAEGGVVSGRPRMLGFQAAGAAPLVHGRPVTAPETVATAIRIGHPASWTSAVAARDESGGAIAAVSDRAILAAWAELARRDGVFVEPASAAAVAGLLELDRSLLPPGATVVVTVTGHGLKDPEQALRAVPTPGPAPADPAALAAELGLA